MGSSSLHREEVVRVPRLRWWGGALFAGSVFAVGVALTLAAWNYSQAMGKAESRYQFEFAANKVVSEITEHLDAHVQVLWGVVALFATKPNLEQQEWEQYVRALRLPQRLPGTRGIGYAVRITDKERDAHESAMRREGFDQYAIRPDGPRPEYLAVAFIAAFGDRLYGARGFDIWSKPERRMTAEQARDEGVPVLTTKVRLLKDPEQPGFLLFVPAYRANRPLDTVEQRRAAFLGVAYSPFRARDLILTRAVVQQLSHAGLGLEIFDGAGTLEDNLLFRSDNFPRGNLPGFSTLVAEKTSGRTWTFRVAQVDPRLPDVDRHMSAIVLASGLLISALASLFVGALTYNRAQALEANRRLRADVARREHAEEMARQSEAKFRRLFDNIPLPTFAIDRDTLRLFAVNRAAVEQYGYSHDEFADMSITDLCPPEDSPDWSRYMEGARDQQFYAGELRHRLKNGTIIEVELMAHNVEFDGREHMIVVAHNVTERKEAERALADSEQQLRQAQKLEAIGQLTGGMAHDFNNILTIITGTIEILAESVADDPKLATITRLITEAATRGAHLTRDLLAFARRQPLQPQHTDVNQLVTAAATLFRSTLGGNVEIETRLEHEPWQAFVDPNQLTSALLNLALNARDAMPDGGRLVLETANVVLDDGYASANDDVRAGAYVMISVSDSGAGIATDIREKVFEPFFTTKEVGKGTGLGLSMVYGFVKQSGGHLQIYSEEGIGTTVRLYLPRACGTAVVERHEIPRVAETGHETILVVEDDALVRQYVTEQLAGLGYKTLVASNAAEALAIADEDVSFDLLFTDIVMPGAMNGCQLAQALTRRRGDLRVLFTSGYSEQAARHSGLLEVGAHMLNKPYRNVDLARAIRGALDGAKESQEAV